MYYNLLIDTHEHPDPTGVLDRAAQVDAPPEQRVEKRGAGQWQYSEVVAIELVSRDDGHVILDVFDASLTQFKALIALFFDAGPSVIQIENDDGGAMIVSTDPDIPPGALENGMSLAAFLSIETIAFDAAFEFENVQGREEVTLAPTLPFLLSLDISNPAERPFDVRLYTAQEGISVAALFETVFRAPFFTKLDTAMGYATYRHASNDIGITVEGVLFEEGWYHDILISASIDDDSLQNELKTTVVTAMKAAGVAEIFLEMDNDGESDVVPVWPVAIVDSEFKQGPLRQFKLDDSD